MAIFFEKKKFLKKFLCHNVRKDTTNAYGKYKKKFLGAIFEKIDFYHFQKISKFKINFKKK